MQADLEFGLFPGGSSSWNPNQRGFNDEYVTAMLKNTGTTQMALKGGTRPAGFVSVREAVPPASQVQGSSARKGCGVTR